MANDWGKDGLIASHAEKDPKLIIDALNKYGVTVLHFVLPCWILFKRNREIQLSSTRNQIFIYKWRSPKYHQSTKAQCLLEVQVANLYGPTEATIDVTYYNYSMMIILTVFQLVNPLIIREFISWTHS